MKPTILFIAGLVLTSGAAGIQPAEVDNVTVRVELNASEVYRSGAQTTPGEHAPSSYPYLSSSKPEALVPYGDTKELTNIYMPDGLIAYYPLDETTGNTANDITTTLPKNNGKHRNFDGNELGAEGNISGGYNFDASNDHLTAPDNPSLDTGDELTVSFWMKADSYPDRWNAFIAKENWDSGTGWVIYDSGGELYFVEGGGNGIEGGWSRETERWYFITATSTDGGSAELYVDGEQIASGSVPLSTNDAGLNVGARHQNTGTGSKDYIDGTVDEVRIYDRAITQDEVQRLYNYQKKDQPGTEQISATITSGGFILANTKGGTPSIESQSETVRSRTFLGRVSPSFGFSQSKTSPTTQVTYNSPYNLTGDSFSTTSSSVELKSVPEIGDNATVLVAPTD